MKTIICRMRTCSQGAFSEVTLLFSSCRERTDRKAKTRLQSAVTAALDQMLPNLRLTVLHWQRFLHLSSPHTTNLQRDAPTSHEFMDLYTLVLSGDLTVAEPQLGHCLTDCWNLVLTVWLYGSANPPLWAHCAAAGWRKKSDISGECLNQSFCGNTVSFLHASKHTDELF